MAGQQQQQYNAHPNAPHPNGAGMHYTKQSLNQSSMNSQTANFMPNTNGGMTSGAPGYQVNQASMMNNNNNMAANHNSMMNSNMPSQRNVNAMRPMTSNQMGNHQMASNQMVNNQMASNNGNTSYPTPPHSNYVSGGNGSYSAYENNNQSMSNHHASGNPMYSNQMQQQRQMQQQQQVCNQQNIPNNMASNLQNNMGIAKTTNQIANNQITSINSNQQNNSNLMNNSNRAYNQHNHSPIPGNPTPPLTPYPPSVGSINNSSTNSQTNLQMSVQSDIKPLINSFKDEERRLLLPVRGGMVLDPFLLEHGRPITTIEFELKPSLYNMLMNKPDFELQLQSFLKDEGSKSTNWPSDIQISINNHLMQIEQGDLKPQRLLFVNKQILSQANKLQFNTINNQCFCKHMFYMQVVNRQTVKSALQNVMAKQLKPVEFSLTQIKQHFNNSSNPSSNSNSNNMSSSSLTLTPSTPGSVEEISLEQTMFKLSLKCPISFKRIKIPARGNECKHLRCFDLESFLLMNTEKTSMHCPICKENIVLENLEVDQYILNAINNSRDFDCDEIIIDSNAKWKASNSMGKVKEETIELNAYQSVNNGQFGNNNSKSSSNYASMTSNVQSGLNSNQQKMSLDALMQNSPFDYQSPNEYDYAASSNAQVAGGNSLDPLAAIEKTIQQHDFGSIGHSNVNSTGNLSSSNTSAQADLSTTSNNQSPNSKQQSQSTINKSPICSTNPLSSSSANTPTSMINNSPHTPLGSNCNSANSNLGPSSVLSTHTNNNDINDLNFDPTAVIDGDAGQDGLNVSFTHPDFF